MDTRQIISTYYSAWIAKDRDTARGLLADNLKFRSPQDNFDSAEEFMAVCWQYSEHINSWEPTLQVYGEAAAYIAFKVGDMNVGEFHRFKGGKIAEVYVTFNVTV